MAYDPTRPDQWTCLHTTFGTVEITVSISGYIGTVVFAGRDLEDLNKHLQAAIAQLYGRAGRSNK